MYCGYSYYHIGEASLSLVWGLDHSPGMDEVLTSTPLGKATLIISSKTATYTIQDKLLKQRLNCDNICSYPVLVSYPHWRWSLVVCVATVPLLPTVSSNDENAPLLQNFGHLQREYLIQFKHHLFNSPITDLAAVIVCGINFSMPLMESPAETLLYSYTRHCLVKCCLNHVASHFLELVWHLSKLVHQMLSGGVWFSLADGHCSWEGQPFCL